MKSFLFSYRIANVIYNKVRVYGKNKLFELKLNKLS